MYFRKSDLGLLRSRRRSRATDCRGALTAAVESLECRALLAAFSGSENSLFLNQIPNDEVLSVYRTETEVQFVLGNNTEDVWDGIDNSVPGVSGHGGKILTFDTTTVAPDMTVGISPGNTVRFHGTAGETAFPFSVGVEQYSLESGIEFVDGASHFSGAGWFYSNGSIDVNASLRSLNGTLNLQARETISVNGTVTSHSDLVLSSFFSNIIINGSVQTESGLPQTGSIHLSAGGISPPSSIEVNGLVATGDAVSDIVGGNEGANSGIISVSNSGGSLLGGPAGRIATGNATQLMGGRATSGFLQVLVAGELRMAGSDALVTGVATSPHESSESNNPFLSTGDVLISATAVTSNGNSEPLSIRTGLVDREFNIIQGQLQVNPFFLDETMTGPFRITSSDRLTVGAIATPATTRQVVEIESTSGDLILSMNHYLSGDDVTFRSLTGIVFLKRDLFTSDTISVYGSEVQIVNSQLIQDLPDYLPSMGEVLTVIRNHSQRPIVGEFAGRPEGSLVTIGDYEFQISYFGGVNGNDVTLTRINAPTLDIPGTSGNDVFEVRYIGAGTNEWLVKRNGTTVFTGALPAATPQLRIMGGAGTDTVTVVGLAGDDGFTVQNNKITVNGFGVLGADVEIWRANGDAGNDTFTVIDGFIGEILGGTGTDRIVGPQRENVWAIQASNKGVLNGDATFQTVESLIGGEANDTFAFSQAGSVTGLISGAGGFNQLNYSARTIGVTITLATAKATGTGSIDAGSIQSIVGSSAFTDKIVGRNTDNVWNITALNSGVLNGTEVHFSSFENITGGTAADAFYISAAGSLSGTVNGGSGTDRLEIEDRGSSLQVSVTTTGRSITNVAGLFTGVEQVQATNIHGNQLIGGAANTAWLMNALGQVVTGSVTYAGFDQIVAGSGVDTLTGPPAITHWTIDGHNRGAVSTNAISAVFSGIENITGGTAADAFYISAAGSLSGTLNGGTIASNSISYVGWTDAVIVNLSSALTGNATAIGGVLSNFTIVIGGSGDDILTGNATLSSVLIGNAGNDRIMGGAGRDLLFGGTGADVLWGGSGEDLMVAGTTAHDASVTALSSLLAEWRSTARNFATRVSNIRGTGSGTRLNNDVFLNPNEVYNDSDLDILHGDGGSDWFWADVSEISDFLAFGTGADRRDSL